MFFLNFCHIIINKACAPKVIHYYLRKGIFSITYYVSMSVYFICNRIILDILSNAVTLKLDQVRKYIRYYGDTENVMCDVIEIRLNDKSISFWGISIPTYPFILPF